WQDPELARRMERVGAGAWMKLSLASLAAAKADYRPRFEQWREVGDLVGIAVQQVVAGEKSAPDALGGAQAEIERPLNAGPQHCRGARTPMRARRRSPCSSPWPPTRRRT